MNNAISLVKYGYKLCNTKSRLITRVELDTNFSILRKATNSFMKQNNSIYAK